MKRIMIITNTSNGLYMFRKELLVKLMAKYEIVVLTSDTGRVQDLKELGIEMVVSDIDRRGISVLKDLKLMLGYFKHIKKEKPELVITYTIKPNIYGSLACEMLGIPYAVNITGLGTAFQKKGALRALVIMMYKVSLRKAKVVFFENCGNMRIFLNERIIQKEQACLLDGAGVNLEKFPYIDYPSDSEPVRFLFIGRVMREKGVNELFRAMRMLRKNGMNCTLDVLGGYEENYESIIHRFEKEGWLNYHGFQDDVRPFIANCHCFVLPSWHEGMANTNLECAASGRPVITSCIPGCKEAVINNISGLLCMPKNHKDLYIKMKRMTTFTNEQRKEMGVWGRYHMHNSFNKDNVVKKTICYLES